MRRREEPTTASVEPSKLTAFGGPWTTQGLTAWLLQRRAWETATGKHLPKMRALDRAAVRVLTPRHTGERS